MTGPAERQQLARYLRKRKKRHLKRPLALRLTACNADSVSAGPRRARRIIEAHAEGTDVLGIVEAFDADVHDLLGADFDVFASTDDDEALRGSAVAVRRDRGRIERAWLRRSITPFVERKGRRVRLGMRERWSAVAIITFDPLTECRWTGKVKVGHNAPPRFAVLQPQWLAKFSDGNADFHLGDCNLKPGKLGPALNRAVAQVNVMFVAYRHWLPVSGVTRVRVRGADHAGARITAWPQPSCPPNEGDRRAED